MTPNLPVLWKPPVECEPEMVRITAAAHPLRVERTFEFVEVGTTVAEIVQKYCPVEFQPCVFFTINGVFVERCDWHKTRITKDQIIVMRAVPTGGGGGFGKILKTLFMVAFLALAIAQPEFLFGAGALFGGAGGAAAFGLVGVVGNLLLNGLIGPSTVANANSNSGALPQYTFGVGGIQNEERPYSTVPVCYGRTLVTPPKGAHSYTVISNSYQYLYALFDLGPGPLQITDIRIGTTDITDYADCTVETREGWPTDDPISIYNNVVHQWPLSIGLFLNGDNGTYTTPPGVSNIAVDITAPGGLFNTNGSGQFQTATVYFQLTIKDHITSATVFDSQIDLFGSSSGNIMNTYVVGVAEGSVGDSVPVSTYDVYLTRTSTPAAANEGASECYWTSVRSWGPAAGPLLPVGHAQIAIVIRATEELNGDVTSLNCIATRYANIWNGTSFVSSLVPVTIDGTLVNATHPAWAAYDILTGSSNARALEEDQVDLGSLLEWALTYPTAEFNYVFSSRTTVWQALKTVGSAGRALPVIRDGLYGYVFDRTQDSPVQMFTPRTVANFKASKNYLDEVDGMEIRYVAETQGWQQHSVYVYASGITNLTANFNFVSTIDLVGVTTDDWAMKLGSYFFAASILRLNTYSFSTDLDHLACNPGDRILIQHDIISTGVVSGRLTGITRDGSSHITTITTDETILGDGTSSYSVYFRTAQGGLYSQAITVATSLTNSFTLVTAFDDHLDVVEIGDLVSIFTTELAMLDAIVKTITPQSDFKAQVTCLDYAPTIHSGDSIVTAPLSNDRINQFASSLPVSSVVIVNMYADENSAQIAAGGAAVPRIHGVFVTNMDGLPPSAYEVQYKVSTDLGYNTTPVLPAGSTEFFIPIQLVSIGLVYDVRVRGTNAALTNPGPWSDVATLTITDYLVAPPAPASLTITPTISGVTAVIVAADGRTPAKYRVYINTTTNFSTSVVAAEGTSSTQTISGLKSTILYYFWASSFNEFGTESSHIGPISGLPLPIGYDGLTGEVTDFLNFLGEAARDHTDLLSDLAQGVANVAFGNSVDYTDLQQGYIAADATLFTNLTDGYNSAINTATGPLSSIVTSIISLQATLGGFSGTSTVASAISVLQTQATTDGTNIGVNASAITGIQTTLTGFSGTNTVQTAISSLQSQITTNGSSITAQTSLINSINSALTGYSGASAVASAFNSLTTTVTSNFSAQASSINSVSTQVGNFYSGGLFRVFSSATPTGADSRIELAVAASSGGAAYGAAVYLDAMTGGTSRITCIANEFFISDGTTTNPPFLFSGGALTVNAAYIQNLTAVNITVGSLNTGTLASNAATDNLNQTTGSTSMSNSSDSPTPSSSATPNTFVYNQVATLTVTQVNYYSPIFITTFGNISASGATGSAPVGSVHIYRNGGQVDSGGVDGAGNYDISFIDWLAPAGSVTYTVNIVCWDIYQSGVDAYSDPLYSNGAGVYTSNSCSLSALSFKR